MNTVQHDLQVSADAQTVATGGARFVAELARAAVRDHDRFTFAVSGGRTPWAMFGELAHEDMPWEKTELFQVDERVAPDGDPSRNLTNLQASIGSATARVHPMPVTAANLDTATAAYATELPPRFDLVHLGLGPDGHTASLVPGDPVLYVMDRLVGLTEPYQGQRRMTLTYPALSRADQLMWLVTGADKKDALARLLAGDESIPAGRVLAARSLVLADQAAA